MPTEGKFIRLKSQKQRSGDGDALKEEKLIDEKIHFRKYDNVLNITTLHLFTSLI